MNLFELFVKIGVDDQASDKISGLSSKLGNGLKTAAKVSAAAITAVTAATAAMTTALVKGVSQTAEYGDNIDKMSQKMGMTAEAYQEWDAVMQHCGTSIDSMQAGMKTLATAAERGSDAFEQLGLSQEAIAGMSQEELFGATITALQNVESETERTYLAGQLLGRGATELGALLNTSAEDTQAMKDRVHELGGVMSNEAVKAAAAYQDSLQDMKTSFSGLKNSLTADFLPGMSTVMDGIASLVTGEDGAQSTISSGISQMIESMSSSLPKFLDAGKEIVEAIFQAIIQNLPQMVSGGIEMLMSIVDGIIDNMDVLIDSTIELIDVVVDKLIENLPKLIDGGVRLIIALAGGLIKAIPKLVGKIPEIISAIVKGFKSGGNRIRDVGKNIVQGVWEGIKSAASWIRDKVTNFFGGIVDDVKDFLGIHSPSKVFAGIGGFMAEGLGEGFEDKFAHVKDDMEDALNFDDASVGINASIRKVGAGAAGGAFGTVSTDTALASEIKGLRNDVKNLKIYLSTGALVGGVTDGIDHALGQKTVANSRRRLATSYG